MSELSKNDKIETEAPQSVLCLNCQQFFGNKHTDNLCSKCYNDRQKSAAPKSTAQTNTFEKNSQPSTITSAEATGTNSNTNEEAKSSTDQSAKTELPTQVDHSRCFKCSKKAGILGFKCKCGYTFCKSHRLPEIHDCSIDFGKLEKERLIKDNVLVQAQKIEKL